jgi:IMP dehydrogenase
MSFIPLSEKIKIPDSITFDDVLLLPGYTDFERNEVDFSFELVKGVTLKLPVLSSPMDTVTAASMAIELAKFGGLGIIHRSLNGKEQAKEIQKVKEVKLKENELKRAAIDKDNRLLVGVAIGLGVDVEERLELITKAGADVVLIDSAHGHSHKITDLIREIKIDYPDLPIIAGNIATKEAAEHLIMAGADSLRVGMGPGSICTTRIVTGMGVPQLTAVSEVVEAVNESKRKVTVIADGGIKQIGDIPKALGFGADCVMLGSMLAGFKQSPGEVIELEGSAYKSYRGMGSVAAMKKGAASRYGQSFDEKKLIAEGVEGLVKLKGDVVDFLGQLEGGLRSSFYDCGCRNISEFYEKARFVKVSPNSLKESHPHSITVTNKGGTYF